MKKINLMVPIIMITAILTACSGEKVDERINTRDGELSFDTSKSTKSELLTSENVKYKDGYHLVLSENEDLYVGTYIYNDKEYTAGYAVNCDFKEYLNFTNIESAEADTINGRNYTIAYYDDNMKTAYYDEENTCVYVYTNNEMSNDDFKNNVEEMNIRIEINDKKN